MATVTVRALDQETKNRLRVRAAENGHSMEQEARDILRAALAPPPAPPDELNWVERIRRDFAAIGYADDLEIPPREYQEPRVNFEE